MSVERHNVIRNKRGMSLIFNVGTIAVQSHNMRCTEGFVNYLRRFQPISYYPPLQCFPIPIRVFPISMFMIMGGRVGKNELNWIEEVALMLYFELHVC